MDKTQKIEIGKRIKALRTQKGMTMQKFGELFDPPASKSIVSRWESGKSVPSNERIKTISNNLKISTQYLLNGELSLEDAINQGMSMNDYAKSQGWSSEQISKLDNVYSNNMDSFLERIRNNLNPVFNSAIESLIAINKNTTPDEFLEVSMFLELLEDIFSQKEQLSSEQKKILEYVKEKTFRT